LILRPAFVASCVTLAVFGLAGCSGEDEGSVADQVSSAVETVTEAIPGTIEVELAGQDSGQSGTATLDPNDDGTLNVTIELSGDQDEPQPAHIHEGSCSDLGEDVEDVVAPLNDVVDRTSITENIEFSLDDVASLDNPGYAIDVHHSHLLTTSVACGDITDVSLP
jgi:CHRD domain